MSGGHFTEHLRKKGWSEKDINSTVNILSSPEKRIKYLHYPVAAGSLVFWTVILVISLVNFIMSVVLIPFMLVISAWSFYLIVAIIALFIGFLFNSSLSDLEHLERKHHLFALIFVPVVAVAELFITWYVAGKFARAISLTLPQSPYITSAVFIVFFLLPYTIAHLHR